MLKKIVSALFLILVLSLLSVIVSAQFKEGTCKNPNGGTYCNAKNPTLNCFCDKACTQYKDCCLDYKEVCLQPQSNFPQPPFGLKIDNKINIDGTVTLSWNNVNGEKFNVYKNKNGEEFSVIAATAEKSYKDTFVVSVPVKAYGYYVTAVNQYGESKPSNIVYIYAPDSCNNKICEKGEEFFCPSNCPAEKQNFRNAKWECYDGFKASEGDKSSCKPSEAWREIADKSCKGHCNADNSKCGVNNFQVDDTCTSQQQLCGDGILDPLSEKCDGKDFGGNKCSSYGYSGGTLICTKECLISTEKCLKQLCGNGVIDKGEQCDGNDFGGKTCQSYGYADGKITCNNDCTFNYKYCAKSVCGNKVCEKGEDLVNCPVDCPVIKERVTCVFQGSNEEQNCYASIKSGKFTGDIKPYCAGKGSCTFDVSGQYGTQMVWISSCNPISLDDISKIKSMPSTTIDGKDEYVYFSCKPKQKIIKKDVIDYIDGLNKKITKEEVKGWINSNCYDK